MDRPWPWILAAAKNPVQSFAKKNLPTRTPCNERTITRVCYRSVGELKVSTQSPSVVKRDLLLCGRKIKYSKDNTKERVTELTLKTRGGVEKVSIDVNTLEFAHINQTRKVYYDLGTRWEIKTHLDYFRKDSTAVDKTAQVRKVKVRSHERLAVVRTHSEKLGQFPTRFRWHKQRAHSSCKEAFTFQKVNTGLDKLRLVSAGLSSRSLSDNLILTVWTCS